MLFEASDKLGGQIVLAGRGETRRQILGVSDWLALQVERNGVDIRYNCYAEANEVLAENPGLVVVATGGIPGAPSFTGGEMALSSWDVLAGETLTGDVLLFDDRGDHQAAVAAEVMANKGASVRWKTPDRTILQELGPTNSSVVMRELYKRDITFETHVEIVSIEPDGFRYRVAMRHVLTKQLREQCFDRIVTEGVLTPMSDVYDELVPLSRNEGVVDVRALADGTVNLPVLNPVCKFNLLRVGDAIASRNIHAAIYDSARLCSGLVPS